MSDAVSSSTINISQTNVADGITSDDLASSASHQQRRPWVLQWDPYEAMEVGGGTEENTAGDDYFSSGGSNGASVRRPTGSHYADLRPGAQQVNRSAPRQHHPSSSSPPNALPSNVVGSTPDKASSASLTTQRIEGMSDDDEQQPAQHNVETSASPAKLSEEPNLHQSTAESAASVTGEEGENNGLNEEENDKEDPPGQRLQPLQEHMELAAKMVILQDEPSLRLSIASGASNENWSDAGDPSGVIPIPHDDEPPLVVASLVQENESMSEPGLYERFEQVTAQMEALSAAVQSVSIAGGFSPVASSMAGGSSNRASSFVGSNLLEEQQDMVVYPAYSSRERNPSVPSSVILPQFAEGIPLDPPGYLREMAQRERRYMGYRSQDAWDFSPFDVLAPAISTEHSIQESYLPLPSASNERIFELTDGLPVDPPTDLDRQSRQASGTAGRAETTVQRDSYSLTDAAIAEEADFKRNLPASIEADDSSTVSGITMDPAVRVSPYPQATQPPLEEASLITAHAVFDRDHQSELRILHDAIADIQEKLKAIAEQIKQGSATDDTKDDEEQSILELYAETMFISSLVLAFGIFIGVSIQHSRETK
jgi:hypothetical protein